MNSDVQTAQDRSASKTSKSIKDSANNVTTPKTTENEVKLDYDAINDVNADICSTERLLEANLKIKKENDANRKSLQNTLIILKEKRHKIIFGNQE